MTGTSYTPEELAAEIENVTLAELVEAARKIQLDSVYTLRGKEG